MKALQKAYTENFGKPDHWIPVTVDGKEILLALQLARPEDEIEDSAIRSVGFTLLEEDEDQAVEFCLRVKGPCSVEDATAMAGIFHAIYQQIPEDRYDAPGMLFHDVHLSLFPRMKTVMLRDGYYLDSEFLDEENCVGRIFRLVPLLEEEVEELEKLEGEERERFVVASKLSFSDPERKAVNMAHETMRSIWERLSAWYTKNKVYGREDLAKGLKAKIDKGAGEKLEKALGVPLPTDFKASFDLLNGLIHLHRFETLSHARIVESYKDMNKLYPDGKLGVPPEKITEDSFRQTAWWHPHWIPIAMDSYGVYLIIDMAPGEDGKAGQVWIHDPIEGPIYQTASFLEWLEDFHDDLENENYEVDEEGFLTS